MGLDRIMVLNEPANHLILHDNTEASCEARCRPWACR